MKSKINLFLAAILVGVCIPSLAQTAPKLLPFQGRLTDQNGVAVSNGVRLVQFKIYGVPTGGSPVWAGELHRTTVNGGLVNVLLGSKTPFTGVDFDQQLYLEITVDINADNSITLADPPMLPRQVILPVVFAKEAADSRLLAGYDWTPIFGTNDPTIPLPASKLADGSLPASKIAPASITPNQIAPLSISAAVIAPSTITSNQVLAESLTGSQIANGTLDVMDLAQKVAQALNPPGAIIAFGGTNIPAGWLLCDGSPLQSTNYPGLYAAIGTAWGAGYTNGVQLGDFNLPDLRGVFLRGVKGSRNLLGSTLTNLVDPDALLRTNAIQGGNTGNQVGSIQLDEFASHNHLASWVQSSAGNGSSLNFVRPFSTLNISGQGTSDRGGSETRPKNAYVNYIIKY